MATIWGLWTSRKDNKSNDLPLILFIFKLTKKVCLIHAVWRNPVSFFFFFLFLVIKSILIHQQRKRPKSWTIHILDNSMYNQILIYFHTQPPLWMSIHCESTSRNHRTELPYERKTMKNGLRAIRTLDVFFTKWCWMCPISYPTGYSSLCFLL